MFLGRPVRPGVDPQWLDTDRGYALAWQANKAATCPNCGTRHDEWDPEQGGDRDAYVPDHSMCRGCQVLAEGHEELPKTPDGAPMPGWRHYLVPAALYDVLHPAPDDD